MTVTGKAAGLLPVTAGRECMQWKRSIEHDTIVMLQLAVVVVVVVVVVAVVIA